MDVLFGDGTAVDLLFQDRDGRQVKLWAILWLDDCTGRLVGHFLPRPRGEGARMEHVARSEEHTSELQSLMRISYAVFCLKKKKNTNKHKNNYTNSQPTLMYLPLRNITTT